MTVKVYILALLLFTAGFISEAKDISSGIRCNALLIHPVPTSSKESWLPKVFTDPNGYQPNRPFKFVVHKFGSYYGSAPKPMIGVDGAIDLLKEPQRISEAKAFSVSVISNEKPITYAGSSIGLIMKVNPENIVATFPSDMQSMVALKTHFEESPTSLQQLLTNFQAFYGKDTPNGLLKHTKTGMYNEVIAIGSAPSGEKVAPLAFAIFDIQGVLTISPEVEAQVKKAAQAANLPVIRISWNGRYELENTVPFEAINNELFVTPI